MKLLVLGRGKTGSLVAEVARERGHSVTVLGHDDPRTGDTFAQHDCTIDFTTPEAIHQTLEHVLGIPGTRIVVGTTGWYAQLAQYEQMARVHGNWFLHGTNFSLAVQAFFRAAATLAAATHGASLSITEAHHITKRDAPSGTALTLQSVVAAAARQQATAVRIESIREADLPGTHTLHIRAPHETLTLTHEAGSRRAFAEGAVLAAEWLVAQPTPGTYNFADVAPELEKTAQS